MPWLWARGAGDFWGWENAPPAAPGHAICTAWDNTVSISYDFSTNTGSTVYFALGKMLGGATFGNTVASFWNCDNGVANENGWRMWATGAWSLQTNWGIGLNEGRAAIANDTTGLIMTYAGFYRTATISTETFGGIIGGAIINANAAQQGQTASLITQMYGNDTAAYINSGEYTFSSGAWSSFSPGMSVITSPVGGGQVGATGDATNAYVAYPISANASTVAQYQLVTRAYSTSTFSAGPSIAVSSGSGAPIFTTVGTSPSILLQPPFGTVSCQGVSTTTDATFFFGGTAQAYSSLLPFVMDFATTTVTSQAGLPFASPPLLNCPAASSASGWL